MEGVAFLIYCRAPAHVSLVAYSSSPKKKSYSDHWSRCMIRKGFAASSLCPRTMLVPSWAAVGGTYWLWRLSSFGLGFRFQGPKPKTQNPRVSGFGPVYDSQAGLKQLSDKPCNNLSLKNPTKHSFCKHGPRKHTNTRIHISPAGVVFPGTEACLPWLQA